MGRSPCCDKANVKKGPWSREEDERLKSYIEKYGTGGNWIALPQKIGLKRCGKSCRLRWLNYLRPNIKHGDFSDEEDSIICSLYIAIGSRWSIIAAHLPGRTDNDIKNHWNTKLKTRLLGKQRRNQQNRRSCYLNQIMMKSKADDYQRSSSPNSEANKGWLNQPSISTAMAPLKHSTDHPSNNDHYSRASISKLQMKVADVKFPCCGNGSHHVLVAPSLKIPQAIYAAPVNRENTFEQGDHNRSIYNSLMKLQDFDFFYAWNEQHDQ